MIFVALVIFTLITTISGINWNGNNWALNCDFPGNGFKSVAIKGEDCGGRCASTSGCTHFTWTDHNGGTCFMKRKNGISKKKAVPKNDGNAVCGIIATDSHRSDSTKSGRSTRYWDCCKPSCAWNGKASVLNPVSTCAADGETVLDKNSQSGCNGGSAYTCNSNIPWKIDNDLSYGFAAANIKGQSEADWCCACYELTFTSGPINGKKMIVQVTNTGGDLGENHFDIQIPGGGVGIFNGCKPQWGAPNDGWGAKYGGVHNEQECNQLPRQIRKGCKWRFQWFKNADNPTFDFKKVTCPQEIISRSGCKRK